MKRNGHRVPDPAGAGRGRRATLGGCLLGIGLVVGLLGSARAQDGPLLLEGASLPYLSVTSEPPGVVIRVIGEYEFVGTTPWDLYRPVSGLYRVEASAPGYGSWSRELVLGPGGTQDLHIKLSRKSRVMAAARSAIVPGWGQHYNEAPAKGNAFLTGEALALVGVYLLWDRYQARVDDFDEVAEIYRDSRDIDAIPILRRELERRDRRASDAFEDVETAMFVAGGIWGLSFLDALFFGPREVGTPGSGSAAVDAGSEAGPALGWSLATDGQNARLGLRLGF